ncbi:hypothetical protein [Aliikangiella maris]|uniref:Uncharacterized protein n=2 Tax=Aliikangiella maris TaxID=3162458 RepID=A0ABV3MNB4_9GAMM
MEIKKNTFELYIEKATKAFVKEILRYKPKPYQRLYLSANYRGEFGRFALGLTEDIKDYYWEYIGECESWDDDLNSRICSDVGRQYSWLIYDEESDDYEDNEENREILNGYFEWHALAQVAIELLNKNELKEYFGSISYIEIESPYSIVKFDHHIPDLKERKAIINQMVATSEYQERLLDGWGNTYNGQIIDPFLSKFFSTKKLDLINQINAAKLASPEHVPQEVSVSIFENFKNGASSLEMRKRFHQQETEGQWAGYWIHNMRYGWIAYYQVRDDNSIILGTICRN